MRKMRFYILGAAVALLVCLSACLQKDGVRNAETVDPLTGKSTVGSAGGLELPFTEEPVTLTIFGPFSSNDTAIDSYNDNTVYQELGRRTGVYVDWHHPAPGQEEESFRLMMSSGQYTDLIIIPRDYEYPGGLDQAVEDGVFMDITELVPRYMPNYSELWEAYSDLRKVIATENGRIVGLSRFPVNGEMQGPFAGLQIRKDWLDACGLSVPVTYEDWTEMLTAFRDRYHCSGALSLHSNGYFAGDHLNAGFGVRHTWMLDGGAVLFGPIQEGWKEYVALMRSWYAAGLIDPNYIVQTEEYEPVTDLLLGETGAYSSMHIMAAVYRAAIPGFSCVAAPNPVQEAGLHTKSRVGFSSYQRPLLFLSASLDPEKIPLALQWIDYQYSEAGMILMNYGVYGDTWKYDSDGNIVYTEKIVANPEGKTYAAVTEEYLGTSTFNWLQDWHKELIGLPEEDIGMVDVWAKDSVEMIVPFLQYTQEESLILTPIMAEVEPYVIEMTNRFIMGETPLDAFDDYVEQIRQMGIDRATEILQNAYDRFQTR